MLPASADEAAAGRAFGLANGGGPAATVGVTFLLAAVTDRSDTHYGFAVLAAVALLATVSAGLLLRTPAPGRRDALVPRYRSSTAAAVAAIAARSSSGARTAGATSGSGDDTGAYRPPPRRP
ncbi:hypothetical protein ABZ924_21565 [Streptomyces sp. NPDC046876]|uniref:hypothetical protein n=1 Tax=Streptomyces sp. NPDC046876 TaxID=3155616 RepID=UPI0034071A79